MDYQVVRFDPITGVAIYGITNPPKIVTGFAKLVQIVVLSFLRNPGQNVLSPGEGSGLRQAIGQYNFSGDGTELRALAVQRTRAVQLEVISRQSPNSGSPSERLKSVTVLNFAYDSVQLAAMLQVKITNEAGDSMNVLV